MVEIDNKTGPGRFSFGLTRIWDLAASLPRQDKKRICIHQFYRAWQGLRSAPLVSAVTVFTIGVTLLIFAVFLLALENVTTLLDRPVEELKAELFLVDGAPQGKVKDLIERLISEPFTEEVLFISKDEALERFQKELGPQLVVLDGLEEQNPLPASIELRFSDQDMASQAYKSLRESYADDPLIEYLQIDEGMLETLRSLLIRFKLWGWLATSFLLVMAGFIISSTIQLALYARRQEIEIMRLVGATDRFICVPFLIEGVLQGIAGGIIGIILLFFFHHALNGGISGLNDLIAFQIEVNFISFWAVLGVFALGIVVGLGGSFIAVKRFSIE